MSNIQIIKAATEEIESKTFGFTEQLLKVHHVLYQDGHPKISRVDMEKIDGTAIVYFPIVDQKFYIAVYFDTGPDISIRHVNTEPYHSVYFRATSKEFSFTELSALTTLKPTGGWNKADKKKFGNSTYNFTSLAIEPNPEADEFEDKMRKLLDLLEQDREGVNALVKKANGYIQVASSFHNGNTMPGGRHLERDTIKRLGFLNLEIDFDIYADGNKFSESE